MEDKTYKINELLISNGFEKDHSGIFYSGNKGYWSNLDRETNKEFIDLLKEVSPLEAVKKLIPELEDHIYSFKREAALELLEINKGDVCIDYGCMWGVLSVGLAKRGGIVIAIDQTKASLEFLNARKNSEGYNNIYCVQDDIRKISLKDSSDFAVVNGVLEWVPEFGDIELKKYFGKKSKKEYPKVSPKKIQTEFLKRVGYWAAIDKYEYAKSLEPQLSTKANERIQKYREQMPSKTDIFTEGLIDEPTYKIDCWYSETVKIRIP